MSLLTAAVTMTAATVIRVTRMSSSKTKNLREIAMETKSMSKLERTRALMRARKVEAYVVPSADSHQSEYTANQDQRRAWISEFTGSAGTVLVMHKNAYLWTDGRYFIQAAEQLSKDWTLMKDRLKDTPSIEQFLCENLKKDDCVGFDPMYFSVSQVRRFQKKLDRVGVRFIPIEENFVDLLREEEKNNQQQSGKFRPHPMNLAGQSARDKLNEVRKTLSSGHVALFTSLDDVAWLLNLRGHPADIPMCPVCKAYVVVSKKKCILFVDKNKKIVDKDTKQHLIDNGVSLSDYDVRTVANAINRDLEANTVILDPASCNYALYNAIELKTSERDSVLSLLKARKNKVELQGLRDAHVRDGAAVVRFLCWLERNLGEGKKLTECDVSDRLEAFRKEMSPDKMVGLSFDTIAGSGSNGAIIHYKPEPSSCATVDPEKMFLCDSGAQYLDGTTDITRTVHFGKPTDHEIRCFTRVLQGHIDLATVVFPAGTSGYQLDLLARGWLWRDGLDYNHGTGHGVGAYLNVHEGPHGIAGYVSKDKVKLERGMTVTDEPGYYEDGAFGIRHENVLVVKDASTKHRFGNKQFLDFETITLCPFQRNCIDISLLTAPQIQWLNAYHKRCREALTPLLSDDKEALDYLNRETRKISSRSSINLQVD